ncbi:gliding motility lipoprotein GldH [Dyadobacter flavalbus]|uniref:Gliding motility lipoprotein GldH n=1 Tax=Dyadobacter flavalbus TaxID=2579942 RepID=A0A5M8QXS4_9BACT|nr:gliding motility lipoprotein GldH [Dyadobacter flavalbus]KAA6440191.1 gliding motility lipoprotein GldH [Dyadobacter flavalbus]
MKFLPFVRLSLICLLLPGCNENVVYKAHENIEDGLWYINNKPSFKVEITDTVSTYNMYYVLRNAFQYPYYNLYLTRNVIGPDNKQISNTLEEVYLSNEVSGKPYGHGLGDLFDHKIPFQKNYRFKKAGIYTFTLSQSMRQNPLPFIMSVGICVEKVKTE